MAEGEEGVLGGGGIARLRATRHLVQHERLLYGQCLLEGLKDAAVGVAGGEGRQRGGIQPSRHQLLPTQPRHFQGEEERTIALAN